MSKKPLACVVLAAGKGSRMKSDTDKVLHMLAGKPMIKWLLGTLAQLSPEKIIVVTAPDMEEVQAACAPHTIAIQQEANGTGGAVKAALSVLDGFDGDVLIALGDCPLVSLQTFSDLIDSRGDAGFSVLGTVMNDPTGYGRLVLDEQGIVQKIVEEKDASDEERQIQIINTGVFCVDGKYLADWLGKIEPSNAQGEYYLTDLPKIAACDGKICSAIATLDPSEVMGCNTKADLAVLESVLQNRLRHEALLDGVQMVDPATVYFNFDTKIAPGVMIEPNVFFGSDVSVEAGVHIKAFSHIEGAYIKSGAIIGPFARLRPGADIGEDVKVGNFVEVKKSTIGKGSKINHLAYVGDCEMGENVNFSAGAITVNYDGYDKHKTIIGAGAMVGSNVNLVAPITVGESAFLAAGSTLSKDVPADALAVAREPVKIHKGWAAKYRAGKEKKGLS